ncbi:beta-propeller domain-containing protein [Thermoanaerobacterium sp. DL9XJH110]|uniref:beta-propeller domain-containing protein n=1 Tax=Thermoanaerobacterium sp. DL9XJH110 TaxID=3386643 RepID=UPI003BB663D5
MEKFKEIFGDRGTDSELLENHRALLFSREKNIMAFPVTVMEIKNQDDVIKDSIPQYGEFSFQGAYIYEIGLQHGFKLKGRITHLFSEDYLKSGRDWYRSERNVERIIYIGDTFYTLSKGLVKASRMSDLKEINSLESPIEEQFSFRI